MPKQPMDRQRSKKEKVRKSLRLISDFSLAERYNDMKRSRNRAGWTTEAEEEFVELEKLVEQNSITYQLTGLGSRRYNELLKKHPPTKEQTALAKAEGGDTGWNAETFPPNLVWECLGGEEYCPFDEWLAEWQDDMSAGETMALFMGCIDLNMGYQLVDMGNGYRQTRR